MPLDTMSPEMHRRVEFSLRQIERETSQCRVHHAELLAQIGEFGLDGYGAVITHHQLTRPLEHPLFRLRVRQILACLQRLAVGVERHAIDFETLAMAEGPYIAAQAWRWHVLIETRRRKHPGFEFVFAELQALTRRIASDNLRAAITLNRQPSIEYWTAIERWARGQGSPYFDGI